MSKRKYQSVAVLMGGPSSEREVSLRSGAAIARGLRQKGYEVDEVVLEGRDLHLPRAYDAVFVALHGQFGEDGTLQAMLRERGIPFTGSSPEASRRAFDKSLSKPILAQHHIPTPAFEFLQSHQPRSLPLPVVVKPVRQGSSIGVRKVFTEMEWDEAYHQTLPYDGMVLVEEFIEGKELTVGVVGGEVFPVIEIRAPQGFYDYTAKYTKGLTEYLVPAPLTGEQTRRCQRMARQVFDALGCTGMGRVDIRMRPNGEAFVLELNNIPGFTETSLLPKAAKAAGIEFADLCERILDLATCHNSPPAIL